MNAPSVQEVGWQLEERLERAMENRLSGRLRDFHVTRRENGLILKGRAATYHAKQLAQHVVMEMADVPILANDIEVR